nr:MAG TPA: hypothetical protein [Caudoviricetes sp.]
MPQMRRCPHDSPVYSAPSAPGHPGMRQAFLI